MIRPKKNVLLKDFTTVGIGGPAKYFYVAKTTDKLIAALAFAGKNKLPYFILGSGSNVLFSDAGFPGLIIKNEIKKIIGFRQIFKVGSGTTLADLVKLITQHKMAGLQKMVGIPGTVGGAIFGNAGAYGQTISDCLTKVTVFDPQTGKVSLLSKPKCHFSYRDSIFKHKNYIILEAHFKFLATKDQILQEEMKEILKDRKSKSFWKGQSPGSFFKNVLAESLPEKTLKLIPEDKINHGKIPAGYLLEEVGAKDLKQGKIQVLDNHANLIINTGGGSAKDFIKLTEQLQQKVQDKFGIKLEPEVQIVNIERSRNIVS